MIDWDMLNKAGSGAALAFTVYILIQGMIKLATKWTDDLKDSAMREREGRASLEKLYADTLAHINANTSALMDLKGSIQSRNLEDTWTGGERRVPAKGGGS